MSIARMTVVVVAAFAVATLLTPGASAYEAAQVDNDYLILIAGQSGDADDAGPSGDDSISVSGRWSIGTTGGDPAVVGDEYAPFVAGHPAPWGAYTLVKIDELDAFAYGDTEQGTWTMLPTADPRSRTITSIFTVTETPVAITRTLTLLRDMVKVQYEIQNTDGVAHRVGIATYVDAAYGYDAQGFEQGNGPFYSSLMGSVTTETVLEGNAVPSTVYGFDGLPNYDAVTQYLLSEQGATKPDKVIVADSLRAYGDFWDYDPMPDRPINDAAIISFWNQRLISPGRKRDPIVSYFGLGQASSSVTPPGLLALQAPFSLKYEKVGTAGVASLLPDPITVYAFVFNQSREVPLQNVQVQLELPFGLGFDDDESQFKTIGQIDPGNEGIVSWRIYADGSESGLLPITLTAAGYPMGTQSVTRMLNVPATESIYLYANEMRFLSAPFQALGTSSLGQQFAGAYRWLPSDNAYRLVPAQASLQAGEGFWYRVYADQELTLANVGPVSGSGTGSFLVPLSRGWNQIGNPYLYGIMWGRCRVMKDPVEGSVSLDEAVARNWIRSALYRWDPTLGTSGEYVYDSAPTMMIEPWEGYWLKAQQPVTLILPPADPIGGGVSFTTSSSPGGGTITPPTPGGPPMPGAAAERTTFAKYRPPRARGATGPWQVQCAAYGEKDSDSRNFFGMAQGASNGYDLRDIDKAPPAGSVFCAFAENNWGENSGHYACDIRNVGSTGTWTLHVLSQGKSQYITLRFSGLNSLPAGTQLRLVDKSSGQSISLNRTAVYRFYAPDGKVKPFQIVSEASRGGRAR